MRPAVLPSLLLTLAACPFARALAEEPAGSTEVPEPLMAEGPLFEQLRIDLIATFASHHWNRNGQQEINPGGGISVGVARGRWTPFVAGVVYDDSHSTTAVGGFAGLRYDVTPWLGVEYGCGYLSTHSYHGIYAVPGFCIGTERLKLVTTVFWTRALGFSLRWRL